MCGLIPGSTLSHCDTDISCDITRALTAVRLPAMHSCNTGKCGLGGYLGSKQLISAYVRCGAHEVEQYPLTQEIEECFVISSSEPFRSGPCCHWEAFHEGNQQQHDKHNSKSKKSSNLSSWCSDAAFYSWLGSLAISKMVYPALSPSFCHVKRARSLNLLLSVASTGAPSNLTKVKEKVRELNVQLDNLCQV